MKKASENVIAGSVIVLLFIAIYTLSKLILR